MKNHTSNTKKEIVPAIMPSSYDQCVALARKAHQVSDWVQLDVMDRKYTPSISWPYTEKGDHFTKILHEEEGLPFWEDINYSVDLMVGMPHEEAIRWAHAGAARIILHFGSFRNTADIVPTITELKTFDIEVGLALLPHEDVTVLDPYLKKIDFVQFMGIEKIGFQGEPFYPQVIKKIEQFHKQHPDIFLAVDGGVNDQTIGDLNGAGISRFAVGSYLMKEGVDAREHIAILYDAIDQ